MNGDELIYCGQRRFRFEREFHGSMFRDNQVSNVYAPGLTARREDFILQEEEVSEGPVDGLRGLRICCPGEPNFPLHLHGRTGTSEKMHCICIDSGGGRENGSVFPTEIQPVVSVLHCDRQIVRVCLLCLPWSNSGW